MFVVFLEFAANRDRAGRFMDGHKAWLQRGFDDGVFLLAGGLRPDRGGGIVADATTRDELERRVADDPFVAEGVVEASIHEIAPARADDRLAFLLS